MKIIQMKYFFTEKKKKEMRKARGGQLHLLRLLATLLMTSCVAQSASTHQRRWDRLREADLDYLDVDSALADDPEDDPIDATFSYDEENVCALKNPLSYCICDDKTLQTAVTIRCQIHDVASQSDDFWKAFQTQSQLQELEIRTILDGRLNFVPTVALQNLPQLRMLEIAGATISTLTMDTFSGSVLMHKLDLTRNQVIIIINWIRNKIYKM